MLRISRTMSSKSEVTLLLEGRILNHDFEQLRRICEETLTQGTHLTLDLSGVSFVSHRAVAALQDLEQSRVALVNCSGFVAEQLKIKKGQADG